MPYMRCYIRYVFKDNPTFIIVTVSFYFMVVLLDILSELCVFFTFQVLKAFQMGWDETSDTRDQT